jgi:hypothetical protein
MVSASHGYWAPSSIVKALSIAALYPSLWRLIPLFLDVLGATAQLEEELITSSLNQVIAGTETHS